MDDIDAETDDPGPPVVPLLLSRAETDEAHDAHPQGTTTEPGLPGERNGYLDHDEPGRWLPLREALREIGSLEHLYQLARDGKLQSREEPPGRIEVLVTDRDCFGGAPTRRPGSVVSESSDCSEVGHQIAALIARLVESHEHCLQLARENGALRVRLVRLKHELRRLRSIPAPHERVPEPAAAPERGAAAEHAERPRCAAADCPEAPSGCAPGRPLPPRGRRTAPSPPSHLPSHGARRTMNVEDVARAHPTGRVGPPMLASLLGGLLAAATAMVAMAVLRWTLQVRTVPERVLEWALLFVPPDQFEAALLRFGFDAKWYALYGAIAGMLLLLAAVGAVAVRRRWSTAAILALGLGWWLFVMVVIMPLTEAGPFAIALIDGTRAAVGGYLAVALTYAAMLVLASAVLGRDASMTPEPTPAGLPARRSRLAGVPSRRAALVLTGAAGACFVGTFLAIRLGPRRDAPTKVIVPDPQEPVPSGGIDPPKPHPNLVTTPHPPIADALPVPPGPAAPAVPEVPEVPAAPAAREPATGPQAGPQALAPTSTPSGILEPGPGPQLKRDADGAVLPSGRQPGELTKLVTDVDDFYIVTKNAGGDPVPHAASWRLRIDGDVQQVIELDYASLRNLPAVDVTKTLECISNFVDKCELAPFGCDLISTARWKGARLSDVLDLAGGVRPGVVALSTISADEFTTALPIEVAMAPDTLLVYEMNGQVLPREHGYPARILVPGRYGMKSAKWVVALRPLRRDFVDWYGQRQWSKDGLVKTMTRIDTPARGAELPPDEHRIAGIAYAGDRGISKVEFSTDEGRTWQVAELIEPAPGADAWVRWQGRFVLTPGAEMTLISRATDGTGELQVEEFSLPQPDGSSGWHHVQVRAATA